MATLLFFFGFLPNQNVQSFHEVFEKSCSEIAEQALEWNPVSQWCRDIALLYFEHIESSSIEINLSLLFVQDHELSEFTDKVLVTESLIQNRHLLRHVVLLRRVSLAFVHRISNDLWPLVEPVVALVHETRLFPFLLRGGRLVAIDRDPEIVISIARSRLSRVDGSLQNLVDRFLEKDTRWFL